MKHVQGGVRLYVPYMAPCPKYKAARVSDWMLDSSGQQLALNMALPDAIQGTIRSSLDMHSSTIRVKGLRTISARRSCLPLDAQITEDGQYEILEATITVPEDGNAQGAQMKEVQGGLQLHVPIHAPCPQYKPVQVSAWDLKSGHHLIMDIAIPNVEQKTLRTWIDDAKSVIHVRGLRSIHQGSHKCLPIDAEISADGQYEILDAAIPFPKGGSRHELKAHKVRGGVRLTLPLETKPRSFVEGKTGGFTSSFWNLEEHASDNEHLKQPEVESCSDVTVEDVTYDWPEKDADAAEGYFDSRGDFYEY
jgi:hypothetical protein